MNIRRVALIFDNTLRPETTGVYCRRALGRLVEVEHFLPNELNRIPRGKFDLFLNVDDGLDYLLPEDLRPAALWAVDTHIQFERTLNKARGIDWVFAAQKDGAEALRQAGVGPTRWLPLACDPDVHGRQEVDKQFDIAFVGNRVGGRRQELLELIGRKYPNTFVGRRYFEAMAEIYSASRIVFNQSVGNDVNMRVFEGLASGSLLLTNDLSDYGLADLFRNGKHLATYCDAEELLDKIDWYLQHEQERERIAAAGRAEALARHTYFARMQSLLQTIDGERQVKTVSPKANPYYEFDRPEVMALVPTDARRVLDVGCGAGRLGRSLKKRQEVEVVGIEVDSQAAEQARNDLDQVIIGNAEHEDVNLPAGGFDCVICADVLEHMREPRRFLRKARRWLRDGGRLIASVPNVRHHSVVSSLLSGNWTYEPAGLLDDDHVRFFTRREIEKLIDRAGFALTDIGVVAGSGYEQWQQQGRPVAIVIGGMQITRLSQADAEEFFVYQYLLTAERADNVAADRLTSVVLVTHNQWSYTHQCLESIRFLTDERYELIVVDNGSTDGTVERLHACGDVRLIENVENRGFPAAANQGIQAARGDEVLLLNNDTLVTTGWLKRLRGALDSDPQIGVAGPCSNNVSGQQQIAAGYYDLSGLDGFAWDWGRAHAGQTIDTPRLVGFCLAIKREVIDKIGLLDEQFGLGNFEDDDYCRRAVAAGYRCVIAQDAFVHHFGSATFRGAGVDFGRLLDENQRKYSEKWQPAGESAQTVNVDCSAAEFTIDPGDGRGLLLVEQPAAVSPAATANSTNVQVCVSLCMIVRDNEETIRPALESIQPWVDEMIVVDTGSCDRTPDIARELGARLFEFPWCDDFSAARNESVKHARGEWIFWMDSDDTIDEENGRKLRELADGSHSESTLGYVMQVHCPGQSENGGGDVTAVDHVKLFRNRPDLRFEGRIHEQILPSIRRVDGEVEFTELFVMHSGADNSAAGRAGKYARDFHLLELELADHPDHPFALFNVGMTHADAGNHEEAVTHLKRCLEVSEPGGSHLRKAYALLAGSLAQTERQEAAWEACREGLAQFPDDPELLFRSGMLHHHFGRYGEAVSAYQAVINNRSQRHFSSVDQSITGFKARHNLALVYEELEQWVDAEIQWRAVIKEAPEYRLGWRGLGQVLMRQQKLQQAEELASNLTAQSDGTSPLRCEGLLLAAKLAQLTGEEEPAGQFLNSARQEFPGDLEPLRELCQWLFERGDFAGAEAALRELSVRDPADGSAPHNLGSIYLACGDPQQAAKAFAASLRIRPNSAATYHQLGQALAATGNQTEACNCWHEALRLDPSHSAARSALARADAAENWPTGI